MNFSLSTGHVRRGHLKGFTLIELLVVIAIIGILSSVVLASLNTARNKGADAAIKGDLAGVRSSAEVLYDSYSNKYVSSATYTATTGTDCGVSTGQPANSLFVDSNIAQALAHARSSNGNNALYCSVSTNGAGYAVAAPLKTTGTAWCIDSTGVSRDKNASGNAYTGVNSGTYPALDATGNDVTCN